MAAFAEALQMLARYALAGQLSAAMYTEGAVEMLLGFTPVGSKGRSGQVQGRLSVADAVDVLVLLEHFLRPLSAPPPRTDLCHSTANGLGDAYPHWRRNGTVAPRFCLLNTGSTYGNGTFPINPAP